MWKPHGLEDDMKISGTSGVNAAAGALSMDAGIGGQTDPMVRDLQRQIEELQNRMKELSSNPELTLEMKAKKRQEIQKQISDLEARIRQRQIEVKREEIVKKRQENYSMDEMIGTKQRTKKQGKQSTGLSAGSMEAMISADTSMKQADINGSVVRKMDGKAGVLEAEIKQDSSMGTPTDRKRKELAEVKAKTDEATSAQMSALAQAAQAAERANEEDKSAGKADENEKKSGTKQTGENAAETVGNGTAEDDGQKNAEAGNTFDTVQLGVPFSRGYQPMDVKL